jgi:hypothetical protein
VLVQRGFARAGSCSGKRSSTTPLPRTARSSGTPQIRRHDRLRRRRRNPQLRKPSAPSDTTLSFPTTAPDRASASASQQSQHRALNPRQSKRHRHQHPSRFVCFSTSCMISLNVITSGPPNSNTLPAVPHHSARAPPLAPHRLHTPAESACGRRRSVAAPRHLREPAKAIEEIVLRPEHHRRPKIVAAGNAARTRCSPSALVRA